MQFDDLAYFESEDFREILKQYEASVKSGHPIYMDADDLADIADYYQYHGEQSKATDAINLAFNYNPDAVGPLLYKAREALENKDFKTARSYAKHIEASDNVEALYLQGEILICEGKVEEADDLFCQHQDEVMLDEKNDYVYDVAKIFSEHSIFHKALEWISRSQGDDSEDFKELMACILFGLGKYKDSERIYNDLIDQNPFSTRYWNALANSQFMQEDFHGAITSSEYAIAIDPEDPESLLSKANSLYNLENYESALTYYQKYEKVIKDDEFGYLHQGTCLINLGRYDEAIQVLLTAAKISDKDSNYLPDIYQELAFAYNEKHEPEMAIHYLDQTDNLECDHISMSIIKGHVYLTNKQPKEAEKVFKEALIKSDNSPQIMLRVIVSLYDNHYLNSSYNLFKNFFKNIGSSWKDGYAYMAACCLDLKREKEFMYYLQIACEKNPKEARQVLGNYFPNNIDPKDYYEYTIQLIKSKKI